jgi:outer membrane protein TolC
MAINKKFSATFIVLLLVILAVTIPVAAQELNLENLIAEAIKRNPEILASQARVEAVRHRIPQAKSLPDPMVMAGYQNEGSSRYTYGDLPDSQWMFSASQMFPFWGKRDLRGEMTARDAESTDEAHRLLQLKTAARVSELYFDLFLAHKNIDLIRDRGVLFGRIEDIAASRYAAGRAAQQEVLMAQTEKYMLVEKEEMLRQKILSLEAMLRSALGRGTSAPLGRPAERAMSVFSPGLDEMLQRGSAHAPEIRSRERMIEAAEAKLAMARKEYYPDVTLTAGVFPRGGEFRNMYSLTATFNVPLYFKSRQEPAVKEAHAGLIQARHDLDAARYMVSAAVRDNYSLIRAADNLMDLYKKGLIPKTRQDFEQAVAGYGTGRTEAIVAISRLKTLIDYESLYWSQFAEREKAIARLHAITGDPHPEAGGGGQK